MSQARQFPDSGGLLASSDPVWDSSPLISGTFRYPVSLL